MQPKNTPLALVAITRSQSSSVVSRIFLPTKVAALLTMTSSLPNSATVRVTSSSRSSHRETSQREKRQVPPASAIT